MLGPWVRVPAGSLEPLLRGFLHLFMRDISIRLATSKDAEIIADLSRQTFFETFALQNTASDMEKFMDEQFTREKLVHEVSEPWLTFFLAFIDNAPVGYVKLRDGAVPSTLVGHSCIEIARIYSVQKMIGKGVGKKLMQTSHEVAEQRKKQILWLAVWKENQRAIDFYEHWGFEIFGEQDFLLGDDLQKDWLMKKAIE
jgi:ribosomal protein S18 acetylase RimI-like enzyme